LAWFVERTDPDWVHVDPHLIADVRVRGRDGVELFAVLESKP
jgi:hypothetical protein